MTMLNFSIIAAVDENGAIGLSNQLLWHLPNDLKRFKSVTLGKPIIMGRKTFESIGKVLPGRDNLILTNDIEYGVKYSFDNLKVFNNISNLFFFLNNNYQTAEIMVIGGGKIYEQFLPYASKIYLTLVHAKFDGDAFFPKLDPGIWQESPRTRFHFKQDDRHAYDYSFVEYHKIF